MTWLLVGKGECLDVPAASASPAAHVYPHGPLLAGADSLAPCQRACEQGRSLCVGINWISSNPSGGLHHARAPAPHAGPCTPGRAEGGFMRDRSH